MHPYNTFLAAELNEIKDAKKAVAMKAYLKNQFEFLGIPTPERREIFKIHLKQHVIKDSHDLVAIVKELWGLAEREFQYCGLETLLHYKKLWDEQTIEIIEYLITTKSWWDTVDPLAYDCAGSYFRTFPESIKSITGEWNTSENIWLQRSSLLFQKSYKNDTDCTLLSSYIFQLASSKEFFIQKAIGWVLREYAKSNPQWVRIFVNEHELAPLSQKEAMKHL
ncbi:DNA alkylation repair protein [Segetibacter aerophilus]|uniref:DNA alkylation repair protein n=1 Tax=Segetibacter aerophilus TaxID=670293 RepID=A0A512B9F5_9BACT|nr:DNA alkylation repair protein [Segetibacter aerophilus]GEO08447.1 hypothetical protein SAE01_09430 [Segetibacter aerophilus]